MVNEKPGSHQKGKTNKEIIKSLIRQLHEGKSPEEVTSQFRSILGSISSTEIAQIEQELVNEGMAQEELRRLCDVHLSVFKESLERQGTRTPELAADHPINTFMEEHGIVLQYIEEIKSIIKKVNDAKDFGEVGEEIRRLKQIAENLMELEKHNVREENVLFPYLQKHGITEPAAIMWAEHNELKEKKKQFLKLLEVYSTLAFKDFAKQLTQIGSHIEKELSSHIYKENNILYPAALQTMNDEEWKEIREECNELGYCSFAIRSRGANEEEMEDRNLRAAPEGGLHFETGRFTPEEIEAFLNSLPVDVTFVDAQDTVRYFNKAEGRIFPRTKAVIGRKVQQCHPPKSLHIVNQVVDDLKTGKRKSADFWIDMNERKIHIRYFPVRNRNGEYLGCMEMTQDITDIQKIKGERRLLSELEPK